MYYEKKVFNKKKKLKKHKKDWCPFLFLIYVSAFL
jgi:hypothetical protein